MQIKNKIFIILLTSLCCFSCISLADYSDCRTFAIWNYENIVKQVKQSRWTSENPYSNFLSVDKQLEIMDTASLTTAILNLKKYCCENGLWLEQTSQTCTDDKAFFNPNSIDSQYLFDHLFDVIMRRLAGLTWEDNIYTHSDMALDATWAVRRKWISEKAVDLSGSDVQSIVDKSKEFWQYNKKYDITSQMDALFSRDNSTLLKFVSGKWWSDESKQMAQIFNDYDKWTLYDRYHNACALTEYFYSLLDSAQNSQSDKVIILNRLAKWYCRQAVANQINAENAYTSVVTQRASNRFFFNYIKWYMSYLYDRNNELKDTRQQTTDRFLDVVRGVSKLINSCVK